MKERNFQIKVRFSEVGGSKAGWEAVTDRVTPSWLYDQVKKHLNSDRIMFLDGRIIGGGFRYAGKYEIIGE
jgi:hypothetical protein